MNSIYQLILPSALLAVGTALINKDANNTGGDDAFGQILVAASGGVAAALQGNDRALLKVLTAIRDTSANAILQIQAEQTQAVSTTSK
jgi:hypothetical protein